MTSKTCLPSWRSPLTKPKLLLFRSAGALDAAAAESLGLTWTDEKPVARHLVEASITEQELALDQAIVYLETKKNLLLGHLDDGVQIRFLVALTKVKNAEAMRDHLIGVISSLEYLLDAIKMTETHFNWKQQCDEILLREPLRFSVKEDCDQPVEALKKMVLTHYKHVL
jgi:hypothetical protein